MPSTNVLAIDLINHYAFEIRKIAVVSVHSLTRPSDLSERSVVKWQVFERSGFTCWICHKQAFAGGALMFDGGSPTEHIAKLPIHATDFLTVDHIIPLALGGGNQQTNLRAACSRCNSSRGHKCGVSIISTMTRGQKKEMIYRVIERVWKRIHWPEFLEYRLEAPKRFIKDLAFMEKVEEIWDKDHMDELVQLLGRWNPTTQEFDREITKDEVDDVYDS